jgi:hypothetical protein
MTPEMTVSLNFDKVFCTARPPLSRPEKGEDGRGTVHGRGGRACKELSVRCITKRMSTGSQPTTPDMTLDGVYLSNSRASIRK